MKHQLRTYQRTALHRVRELGSGGLFMDMRLGKTLVMIRALRRIAKRVLVVAPSSALGSWVEDLTDEGESYSVLLGTRKQRLAELAFGRKWCLLNREGHRVIPEVAHFNWDAVILDESHFIKNPRTAVTKFYLKNFRDVPFRWVLTGTPNPERTLDVVTQMIFAIGHCAGFESYWSFINKFGLSIGFDLTLNKAGREVLPKFVGRNAFILSRKSAGVDVPHTKITRYFDLPKKLRQSYDNLEQNFVLEHDGVIVDSTLWRMSKYAALRALCSGFMPLHEADELVWSEKYKTVVELLKGELAGQQIVVWFSFTSPMKWMEELLKREKITVGILNGSVPIKERLKRVKDFDAGKFRVFLIQERVGEAGMKLAAADTAIYFTEPPSLTTKKQSQDRILLLEKSSIMTMSFVTRDTVEQDIHRRLAMKTLASRKFLLEAMKERHRAKA